MCLPAVVLIPLLHPKSNAAFIFPGYWSFILKWSEIVFENFSKVIHSGLGVFNHLPRTKLFNKEGGWMNMHWWVRECNLIFLIIRQIIKQTYKRRNHVSRHVFLLKVSNVLADKSLFFLKINTFINCERKKNL